MRKQLRLTLAEHRAILSDARNAGMTRSAYIASAIKDYGDRKPEISAPRNDLNPRMQWTVHIPDESWPFIESKMSETGMTFSKLAREAAAWSSTA